MGTEVFPQLHEWLCQHDGLELLSSTTPIVSPGEAASLNDAAGAAVMAASVSIQPACDPTTMFEPSRLTAGTSMDSPNCISVSDTDQSIALDFRSKL